MSDEFFFFNKCVSVKEGGAVSVSRACQSGLPSELGLV
jgi:hypothetical protein